MANTYEKQATRAAAMITKAGQAVRFYKETSGSDPITGEDVATVESEVNGFGLVFGYSAGEIDGTVIQKQDAYVLYTGDSPSKGMNMDHGGRTWLVESTEPLQPTSSLILTKVQIR